MTSKIKRIVCIDDDETILKTNKKLLESSGDYEVIGFTGGPEALRNLKVLKPDLILLDMQMPGMDGVTVLETLKGDPDIRTIPVIFMTSQKTPADVKKYMDLGALSVITKPIDPEDFPHQIAMISEIILAE